MSLPCLESWQSPNGDPTLRWRQLLTFFKSDDYIISDSWIIAVAHVQASPKAHVQANPRPYRGGYISNIKHPYGSIYIYT